LTDNALVWERPEPPEKPTPTPLSRARIVAAAIALADAEGLEAVSIRRVAAALDAGPMRLYRYVDTKEELLALMVDAVRGESPLPAGDTWRETLRSVAAGLRDTALRHEWFADLFGGRPHLGPNSLRHVDAALASLRSFPEFGDADTAMGALEVLAAYLSGAVRNEVADLRLQRATGQSEVEWQRAQGPYIERAMAGGDYPALAEAMAKSTHRDASEVFELGLECLLDGIGARLRGRSPGPAAA
jgi:AcrR family transcriptional regulator